MTHDELLVEINKWAYKSISYDEFEKRQSALRAVVELHPMWTDYRYTETNKELVEFCGCCQEKWPCKTIQAIESALQ
jgi:hypothetical protein